MKTRNNMPTFLLLLFVSLAVAACGGGNGNGDGRANSAPIANAGADQTIPTGSTVVLDGSGSSDPDGDPLTYSWNLTTRPEGSQAVLSDATAVKPTFIADVDGSYILTLVVSDGMTQSDPDTVIITSVTEANSPPVIASFTATPSAATVGDPIVFSWEVSDPNDDDVTCTLDIRGDGSADFFIDDCMHTSSLSYAYTIGGTYIPKLTASDGEGGFAEASTTVSISGQLNLTVISPTVNQFVGETLRVVVTIVSSFEVSEVNARVGDREAHLTFAPDAYCDKFGCHPGFAGDIALTGLERGAKIVEIIAQDVQGTIALGFRSFIFDKKPIIHVLAPLQESVATPDIEVKASCTDDDPAGCDVMLSVLGHELISAPDSIDTIVDLAEFNGMIVALELQGRDSVGQTVRETRTVYVEPSARLSEVASVAGPIVDVESDRLLYVISGDNGDGLKIHNWATGATTTVSVPAGKVVDREFSFLTPTGAIYITKDIGGNVLSSRIYDWRNGTLENLGQPNSAHSLTVEGDYAIWNEGQLLFLRQFSAGTVTQVSTSSGNWQNDVASNGVVGFWSTDYNIISYKDGTFTELTNDGLRNTYVLTDGTAFIYRKHTACCSNQEYAITLHDGNHEIILTDFREREPLPGTDFQIRNGWVAYTELGNNGQLHVWLRSPFDDETQLTFFGSSSHIDTLADNGEIMLINNGIRYLGSITKDISEVSTDLGKSVWIDGSWYVVMGRSLFQVN
jgi:hypothetical protein